MTETEQEIQQDDVVLPFRAVKSGINGRLVRIGSAVDEVLGRHDYPEPVARVLGEALTLAAMLGAALKFQSKFILQTKTDGPIDFLVVDYVAPGAIRGYASFDEKRVSEWQALGSDDQGMLLGKGHMAMTIDPLDQDMSRYQGVVALDNDRLLDAAHTYFRQSEQLPTFATVAIAKHYVKDGVVGSNGSGEGRGEWHWRAGGLIVQNLASQGGNKDESVDAQAAREEAGLLFGEDDDDWARVRLLSSTVEDHELLDPLLSSEDLLYRLFHEEGIRIFDPHVLEAKCQCSRARIENIIDQFSDDELEAMLDEQGKVVVTCEFCTARYSFEGPDAG